MAASLPPSPAYDAQLTLIHARARHFADNGLGEDGGYGGKLVKFRLGPLMIQVPNTPGRRRATRFHDLHHILTGYGTDWKGEFQISAWEIATGCGDHYTAWSLNLGGMAVGLVRCPRAVFRAFVRGRKSKNLYREDFNDHLLGSTVGAVRSQLGLDREVPPPSISDAFAFCWWLVPGIVSALVQWLTLPLFLPFAVLRGRVATV
jgi:hypothetical protein